MRLMQISILTLIQFSALAQTIECQPITAAYVSDISVLNEPNIVCRNKDYKYSDIKVQCTTVELFDVSKWEKDTTKYSSDIFPVEYKGGWTYKQRVEINRVSGEGKKVISAKGDGNQAGTTTVLYKCKPVDVKPMM